MVARDVVRPFTVAIEKQHAVMPQQLRQPPFLLRDTFDIAKVLEVLAGRSRERVEKSARHSSLVVPPVWPWAPRA